MNVTSDNSYDSSPIGCTFPLHCCNKKDLSGKGKTENSLRLWEISAMLLEEEKRRCMLNKARKMPSLLHSPFHHGVLHTQIMYTKMESTSLLSRWVNPLEWATSAAYAIACLRSVGEESRHSHYWDLSRLCIAPDLFTATTKPKSLCTIWWMPLPCQIVDVPSTAGVQRLRTILPID